MSQPSGFSIGFQRREGERVDPWSQDNFLFKYLAFVATVDYFSNGD